MTTADKPEQTGGPQGHPKRSIRSGEDGAKRDTAPEDIAMEERQRSKEARESGGLAETDSRREKHRKPS